MQLKDFISTALVDICQGIAEAQKEINSSAIAPQMTELSGPKHAIEQINFEVCVTVDNVDSSKDAKGHKLGILKVISAEIGKSTHTETKSNTISVNKISFNVPYIRALVNKSKN